MFFQRLFIAFTNSIPRSLGVAFFIVVVLTTGTVAFGQIVVDTEMDMLPATDGNCTLREAVINANDDAATHPDCNAGTGANDQVTFAPGVDNINMIGPIDITDSLIMGNEDQPVTITGSGDSRLFAVPVPVDIELRFMTLSGGFTEEDGDQPDQCVRSSGEGGALCSLGTVNLNNVVISDSQTTGDLAFGGGLYAFQLVSNNFALVGNSTLGEFSSGGGGFLFGDVNQVFVSALVGENLTTGDNAAGGGISSNGTVFLNNSLIVLNGTSGTFSPGGGVSSESGLSIQSSTIALNQTLGLESSGGGISSDSLVEMQNSTVSNNSASPINSTGGGLSVGAPPVILNSTISNNSSSRNGAGITVSGVSDEPVQLISTILADNDGPAGNLFAAGLTVNGEASLFGDDPSEITGLSTNMVFSNDALLEPLADNGCAEPAGAAGIVLCVATRLLQPLSLAREQGINPLSLISDQRGSGFDRTIGPQTDIGAVEMPFVPTFESIPVPVFHPLGLMMLVLCILILALISLPRTAVSRN